MSQDDDNDALTTVEVILSRVINTDGRMAFKIKHPETYNMVEILGLLEAAKFYLYGEMRKDEP
jgi:hypothetical protein